jgi:hypothetical protein
MARTLSICTEGGFRYTARALVVWLCSLDWQGLKRKLEYEAQLAEALRKTSDLERTQAQLEGDLRAERARLAEVEVRHSASCSHHLVLQIAAAPPPLPPPPPPPHHALRKLPNSLLLRLCQARMESVSLQRQKLATQVSKARLKADAPVPADQTDRCLICKEDIPTISLTQHTRECLLELVQFTASTAAKDIEERPVRQAGQFRR